MKKAMIVASFGTSHFDAIEDCIVPVEQAIQEKMPEWDVFRAFTSSIILNKLQGSEYEVQRPIEVLQNLAMDGYEEILIQPTHILPGKEYHDIKEEVSVFAKNYPNIMIELGESLLYHHSDYINVIHALKDDWPECKENEKIILFAHGTDHFSNACYFELQYMLDALDSRALVGTVEAVPSLEDIIVRAKQEKINSVFLYPLMLVSGDHVKNDMMGDDTDSWKNQFIEEGFQVQTMEKGIGQNPKVVDLYVKKAQQLSHFLSNKS